MVSKYERNKGESESREGESGFQVIEDRRWDVRDDMLGCENSIWDFRVVINLFFYFFLFTFFYDVW